MSQILHIKKRLKSIQNIHKVTTAMETMAITGLRRLQNQFKILNEYSKKTQEVFGLVCNELEIETEVKTRSRVYFIFLSSRGFCGNFNNNLIEYLDKTLTPQYKNTDQIYLCGPLANRYLKRLAHLAVKALPASEINPACLQAVNADQEVYVVYNKFISILSQLGTISKIYPFAYVHSDSHPLLYFEPSAQEVFQNLLPMYLKNTLQSFQVETLLGEYCNRFQSMKSANDNAAILIEDLRISLNKTRQSTITAELSEVVSAFEVMRSRT